MLSIFWHEIRFPKLSCDTGSSLVRFGAPGRGFCETAPHIRQGVRGWSLTYFYGLRHGLRRYVLHRVLRRVAGYVLHLVLRRFPLYMLLLVLRRSSLRVLHLVLRRCLLPRVVTCDNMCLSTSPDLGFLNHHQTQDSPPLRPRLLDQTLRWKCTNARWAISSCPWPSVGNLATDALQERKYCL